MAAKKNPKLLIHLDLLKSQTGPGNLIAKITRWLLSTDKYILIAVEIIVLITLFYRFKLDGELEDLNGQIDKKKDLIQTQRSTELKIKQIQFQLTTINTLYKTSADYPQILKNIADQTPRGVKFTTITMGKSESKIIIKINAQAETSSDVSNFTAGLKTDKNFSDVTLVALVVEQNVIKFTINLSAPLKAQS